MISSPIFMVSGGNADKVERFYELIRKGTPRTLLIRTRYVPRKGESPAKGEKASPLQIKSSMQFALVNKEYEVYVIDRNMITDEDYQQYLYTAKINGQTLYDVTMTSDNDTFAADATVVSISGNADGLMPLLKKGFSSYVEISTAEIESHPQRLLPEAIPEPESPPAEPEELSEAEKEELEKAAAEKLEQRRLLLSDTEIRNRLFIDGLAYGKRLITVDRSLLPNAADQALFKQLTHEYRYTGIEIDMQEVVQSAAPEKEEEVVWGTFKKTKKTFLQRLFG